MNTLWTVLRTKGSADQVAKVEKLTKHAAALLDLVRDTFPTYTLHNHVHAENVVRLMEQLLGDRLEDLSALESAILLLSAYFHDIGMVYSADERGRITQEPAFDDYLRTHPEEYLRFQNSAEPDESVIEGYCRWRHAVRVYDFLSTVSEDLLTWDGVYLRKHLGVVCKSHNDNVDTLKDEIFDTDFLGTCDLRFCAILLRLADILDFDNSRSPESVYEYLELGRRATPRTAASDVEWLKHLNSNGFVFPASRSREYAITLVAGPDHPAVESDVRDFLDVIESELASCQSLLQQCAARWSSFTLPGKVDRRSIVSKGYVFGDFRFKLDRQAILDLFMGENLYSDPSVFLRELVQNSIDATRSRAKLQNLDPVAEGWDITLTDWHDSEGYQWIRIDDNGSGMNRHIVDNYLLRIGRSYYSSPEFQAELRRHARPGERPLVSIGKFGVGLLSCFMLADQVELTTLRVDARGNLDKPLRMSFHHVANYSFFQTPDEKPTPLPGKYGPEAGYRTSPGTSIVVRIDPRKHGITLDIERLCRAHLLAARVPVTVNGKRITDGKAKTDRALWPNKTTQLAVRWVHLPTTPSTGRLAAALEELSVELTPLDFSLITSGRNAELDGAGFLLTIDSAKTQEMLREVPLVSLPGLAGIDTGAIPDDMIKQFRGTLGRVTLNVQYAASASEFPHIQLHIYTAATNDLLRKGARWLNRSDASNQAMKQWQDLQDRIRPNDLSTNPRPPTIAGYIDWRSLTDLGFTPTNLRSWSHNGIRLPIPSDPTTNRMGLSAPASQGRSSPWVDLAASHQGADDDHGNIVGAIYGSFWLTDELRPVLNIARTKVNTVPFRLYSAINLATRRSLSRLPAGHCFRTISQQVDALDVLGAHWKLSEIVTDPLMCQPDGWLSEPMLKLDTGEPASILDIREIVTRVGECVVYWPLHRVRRTSIHAHLLRALMCINLDLVVDSSSGFVKVRSNAIPHLDHRLERYEPGFLLPYTPDSKALILLNGPLLSAHRPPNLHHELIAWFLQVTSILQTRAPALETQFCTALRMLDARLKEPDPLVDLRNVVDRIGAVASANGGSPFAGTLDESCFEVIRDNRQ